MIFGKISAATRFFPTFTNEPIQCRERIMKKNKLGAVAFIAAMSTSGAAMAAGTAPGVTVSNSIDISYEVAGTTVTTNAAATADFVVDRKVAHTFASDDAGDNVNVAPGSIEQIMTFRLDNIGNDASGFDFDLITGGTLTLTYDAAKTEAQGTYYVTFGSTQTKQAGDTDYNTDGITTIGDIAADGIVYMHVTAFVEAGATDGDQASFTFTSRSLDAGTSTITSEDRGNGLAAVDTVFADTDLDGVEVVTATLTVTAPNLTFTKDQLVLSENLDGSFDCTTDAADGGEATVPGACVEYTLTVTNDAGAGASADNLVISDPLPAEVTYVTSDNTGFDTVTHTAGTVTGSKSSLAPGETATMTIRVLVN